MQNIKISGVQLPDDPQAIVFVNGIKARNMRGFMYMWRNLNQFRNSPAEAEGCTDIKAGIVGPNEFVVVSYWESAEALRQYFKAEAHRHMMKHFYHHPDDLELYNETYHPSSAGKYNAVHGLATVYPLG